MYYNLIYNLIKASITVNNLFYNKKYFIFTLFYFSPNLYTFNLLFKFFFYNYILRKLNYINFSKRKIDFF